MTSTEIKTEINSVLNSLPENTLPDVLNFLKDLQSEPSDIVMTKLNLKKILEEDKELLAKLAK